MQIFVGSLGTPCARHTPRGVARHYAPVNKLTSLCPRQLLDITVYAPHCYRRDSHGHRLWGRVIRSAPGQRAQAVVLRARHKRAKPDPSKVSLRKVVDVRPVLGANLVNGSHDELLNRQGLEADRITLERLAGTR